MRHALAHSTWVWGGPKKSETTDSSSSQTRLLRMWSVTHASPAHPESHLDGPTESMQLSVLGAAAEDHLHVVQRKQALSQLLVALQVRLVHLPATRRHCSPLGSCPPKPSDSVGCALSCLSRPHPYEDQGASGVLPWVPQRFILHCRRQRALCLSMGLLGFFMCAG